MIEQTILENLALNEKFNRKVLAFIKPEYFQEQSQKLVFSLINQHVNQYNTLPTRKSLAIDLQNSKDINQDTFNAALSIIKDSAIDTETDHQWLLDQTEQFCKDRALHNAIFKSISILNDSEKKLSKGAIPEIVSEALAVSFDTRIGHDYLEDAQLRYDLYHNPQKRLKFDVEILNEITRGGVNPKTLNLLLAPTGVGKSFWMCHFAATNLMQGKKVLYITLEMSEDQISKRIDANLLGIDIADIDAIPIKTYLAKINELKQRTPGKLIVREYPSGYGSVLHFRGLLQELRLKKKFVPDVIYIDYLNICSSARITKYVGGNSYEYVKCIAEEVRGLAIEQNLPIWSATQVNRSGAADSDYDITNISESFGIAHTADLLLGIINTEQLDSLGQMMVKQLKNRYNRPSPLRFIVGVDKAKMRLYDVEQSGQLLAHMQSDDKPLFDKTNTGQQIEQESKPFFQKNKAKFKPKF